jgi:hypothetical protein
MINLFQPHSPVFRLFRWLKQKTVGEDEEERKRADCNYGY